MPTVTVKIRHAGYTLACDEGQEGHLCHLAANLDKRLAGMNIGKGSDIRLLVMAALMMEHEPEELKTKLSALSEADPSQANTRKEALDILVKRLENLALEAV